MRRMIKLRRLTDKVVYSPYLDQNAKRQQGRETELELRRQKASVRPEVDVVKRSRGR